jgi:hypothetical protein
MDGNLTVRRYTATVANINCAPVPTNSNTTLTFTLPNTSPTAEVTLGAGGIVVGVANTAGLAFGPAVVTNANTVRVQVSNPTNNAVAAVNATFEIWLFAPTGASSGVATGAVT